MKNLPNICGFHKVSEIGDDVFVPSIFLGSCNFKCPYCMNSKLVKGNIGSKIDIEDVKKFVEEAGSKWVMISGGEPTCTPIIKLITLFREIKSWGCKIGMSTNGSNYDVLSEILPQLNYVALDIKSPTEEGYNEITNAKGEYSNVILSRNILLTNKWNRKDFDYEIRTTLYPVLIDEYSLMKIGERIVNRNDKWVLQQFRHAQNMLDPSCKNIKPYSDDIVERLIKAAEQYCDNVSLRFV